MAAFSGLSMENQGENSKTERDVFKRILGDDSRAHSRFQSGSGETGGAGTDALQKLRIRNPASAVDHGRSVVFSDLADDLFKDIHSPPFPRSSFSSFLAKRSTSASGKTPLR